MGRTECALTEDTTFEVRVRERDFTLIGQTTHCSYKENKEMTALKLSV